MPYARNSGGSSWNTGGASSHAPPPLNHASPVNKRKQGGSRSAPSLLPLTGGGLHGDLQHKKTQKTTQSQQLGSLLSDRSSSSWPSRRRRRLDHLQNKAKKIHKRNATNQHKIDFILFRSRVCFCLLLLGMAGPPWVRLRAERAGRRCCCRGRGGGCGRGATPVADDGGRWLVSDLARLKIGRRRE